jgi:hypothetical protein
MIGRFLVVELVAGLLIVALAILLLVAIVSG